MLSCAMKFESYPHDTQICSMSIESCKYILVIVSMGRGQSCTMTSNRASCFVLAVSHTVHDLVFIWNMTDPLVVNPEIELPQLDISNNYTADCTIEYSTGEHVAGVSLLHVKRVAIVT